MGAGDDLRSRRVCRRTRWSPRIVGRKAPVPRGRSSARGTEAAAEGGEGVAAKLCLASARNRRFLAEGCIRALTSGNLLVPITDRRSAADEGAAEGRSKDLGPTPDRTMDRLERAVARQLQRLLGRAKLVGRGRWGCFDGLVDSHGVVHPPDFNLPPLLAAELVLDQRPGRVANQEPAGLAVFLDARRQVRLVTDRGVGDRACRAEFSHARYPTC